jgi:predicted metal-binding protein
MADAVKIGIIICNRYHTCAGGKCFRSLREREGAFRLYEGRDVQLIGYTTCDGCPGGNVEYAPEEMKKNGAQVIHLATGLVVGYPPCPHIDDFVDLIEKHHGLKAVVGTHPIPEKYFQTHRALGTWASPEWQDRIKHVLEDQEVRLRYN